jgi:hypothetical protein
MPIEVGQNQSGFDWDKKMLHLKQRAYFKWTSLKNTVVVVTDELNLWLYSNAFDGCG